jgi:hypothetical protein
MIRSYLDRIWEWWFTPLGVMVASMFAGEYFKPSRIISNFLDRVRGGL